MSVTTTPATLYGALAKAQAEMPTAVLNRVNPHFKNKYADLASLRTATIPALSKHGLCIVQYTDFEPVTGTLCLRTRLAHASGEFIEGSYPLPNLPDKPQVMGSALTYARRYGWGAILGEASEEDDDAIIGQTAGNGSLISKAQLAELNKLADEVQIDTVKFYEWLHVTAMADIPAASFAKAKAALESKRKAK